MKPLMLCLLLLTTSAAYAKSKPKSPPTNQSADTVASILDRSLTSLERQFVSLVDAMPEDKFDFAPTTPGEFTGVRTFAFQARHVAANNYAAAALILGENPPAGSENDDGPDNLKSKAEILQYVKDSFAYSHKAMQSLDPKTMLEHVPIPGDTRTTTRFRQAIFMVTHPWDHYGQMVEYARMNGIIPPASRPQPASK